MKKLKLELGRRKKKSFEFSIFHRIYPFLASIANTCIYVSLSLFYFYFYVEKMSTKHVGDTHAVAFCRCSMRWCTQKKRRKDDVMQCNDACAWQMCPSAGASTMAGFIIAHRTVKTHRMECSILSTLFALTYFNSVWMEKLWYLVRKAGIGRMESIKLRLGWCAPCLPSTR